MTRFNRRTAILACALGVSGLSAAQPQRPFGDSQVVAAVPAPGFPEGIAVKGDRVYVSGPATFGNFGPALVWEYDIKSKALLGTYPVTTPGQGMRGLSCIAFGPDGKLYAVEPFVGIIRMNLDKNNTQSVYAPFTPMGPSLLNDLAFDEFGNLFVTDSFAATIYRVPAGGGAPQVWFQDARLAGNPNLPFGVNGIRIDKKNKKVYVSVTVDQNFLGVIYRLPLVSNPAPAEMETFHVYLPGSGPLPPAPDGIAFGKSGDLYVALAGTNQISIIGPNGVEKQRLNGPAKFPNSANVLPWTNPANIAFTHQDGTILVTNHASLLPPSVDPLPFFAIFDVSVGDNGEPLQ